MGRNNFGGHSNMSPNCRAVISWCPMGPGSRHRLSFSTCAAHVLAILRVSDEGAYVSDLRSSTLGPRLMSQIRHRTKGRARQEGRRGCCECVRCEIRDTCCEIKERW